MPGLETAPLTADPLADLVRAHQVAVWRRLRALGCSPADADEIAVESFAVAHERGFVAHGRAEAAAFLHRTARFLWLRRQRGRRREHERLAAAADRVWARCCARDDGDAWVDALRACVAHLDGRAALAVRLCYGEELDRDTAAAHLGLKPNGLKTLLQRARAALRSCIERRMS